MKHLRALLRDDLGVVTELLHGGFKGNEVVIVRKVSASKADTMVDGLELIEVQLRVLRLAPRVAAVTADFSGSGGRGGEGTGGATGALTQFGVRGGVFRGCSGDGEV